MLDEERRILDFLHKNLASAEERLFENLSQTFRWVMATLFAANGGAIVAMASNNEMIYIARGALIAFLSACCSVF